MRATANKARNIRLIKRFLLKRLSKNGGYNQQIASNAVI